MSNYFISYARSDISVAKELKGVLGRSGKDAFIDVQDIQLGGNWREGIEAVLQESWAVIVLLSPQSASSPFVTYEWSFALGAGVPVIPVLTKSTRSQLIHKRLDAIQRIDLRRKPRQWKQLVRRLRGIPRPRPNRRVRNANSKEPRIWAEFVLEGGKPARINRHSYRVVIGVRGYEPHTKRVRYRIHDETFDETRFTVTWGPRDFREEINTYGDIPISAVGEGDRPWRAQAMLAEALRRRYRSARSAEIDRAIVAIESN